MQNNLIIADLHLHSKYSRAVSQKMDLTEIASWASKKGIDIVATADWTHPLWLRELKTELKEAEPGLFELKKKNSNINPNLRFILVTEVSNIYSQAGITHRIHTLIFSPSFKTCEKVQKELLNKNVKIRSDGRPIMGLTIIELVKLLWPIDKDIFIIPAHIWTPWFSLYGSKSGFDAIKDCYGKYADKITAIETGLSSDPIMNWSIPELKQRAIVSFSDAHSGPKLGREATVFKIQNLRSKIQYLDIVGAMKKDKKSNLKIAFTIEFFPEEGKYHYSGHRKCGIVMNPKEVRKNKGICPKCHKPLTIGVMDRVQSLTNKLLEEKDMVKEMSKTDSLLIYPPKKNRPPFVSIIPLMEILSHIQGVGPQSKKVRANYDKLIDLFDNEFNILLFTPIEKIKKAGEKDLAIYIEKMRKREVNLMPGYDGIFGKITVNVNKHTKAVEKIKQKALF